ncbi:DUF7660 family protein [Peribacillus loiseleuriae]|uniref:DUF7660 family protein n=1 Tax=Peribacillus loiseleuriae TaxID=1679170 RepID=UPI003D045EB0
MDVYNFVDNIKTREDLIHFITLLRKDYEESSLEWENADLSKYLEALEASTADISGSYKNQGISFPEQPSWQLIAKLLLMAAYYE